MPLRAGSFAQVEGIDFAAGLHYAAGSRELYAVILNAFAANHCGTAARVRTALDSGDVETAKRAVHSLKGAAGTVGAFELQETAKAVENAIADHLPQIISQEMKVLERLIGPMMEQIQSALISENSE